MSEESICFVGDVHGSASWFGYVLRQVSEFGVRRVIQLGDFGLWPGRDGQRYLDEIARLLSQYVAELIFIDGNHDWHEERLRFRPENDGLVTLRPRLRYAPRGTVLDLDGLRVLAIGGAPSIDADQRVEGVNWWRDEILSSKDAERCLAAGVADVVVAHDCPAEVTLSGLERWAPGEAHRALMSVILASARPRWWFGGHYHRRHSELVTHQEGFRTRVEILHCEQSTSSGMGWTVVEIEALRRSGDDQVVVPPSGVGAKRIDASAMNPESSARQKSKEV